jgi:uncharacterized protein YndB with AHSA1/START domain
MSLDVSTEIVIAAPPEAVAAYATDPANAPRWYANIESGAWETPPPVGIGSRFAFVARFMRRRLEYSYEVVDHVPGRRLVMRTAEGPFPMETTYTWEPAGDASTRMALHNRGEPSGFGRVAAPFMARAVRRANRRDLAALKRLVEAEAAG